MFERLSTMVADRRVTPTLPPGRTAWTPTSEELAKAAPRDGSASWSAYISYVDASGARSERRFTCHSIGGFAGAEQVTGYCHERAAPRTFRIDRIAEMACAETGELLDPIEHFAMLRENGALRVKDKALIELSRVLVFLAECDGTYHPLEREAVHTGIERFGVRFGANDACVEEAIKGCRRLKPDGEDLVSALRLFAAAPEGARLCRFVLDAGAAIIDADGRHSPEELGWAAELSNSLKAVCDGRAR